ncbi:MAG: hypothetical protein ACR2KJ_14830 [Jatrophihabitans sp.]
MARALFGYVDNPCDHRTLELQVARLRGRIRELEVEVAELRGEAAARDAIDRQLVMMQDEPTPALA